MAAIGAIPAGTPKQISATANVKPGSDGVLLGILCSSSTSGTVTLYDDPNNGTAGPSKIVDTITLTAGTWYPIPIAFSKGLNVVVGGTASITVVVA